MKKHTEMKTFLVITCVAVAASVGALDPALEAKLQKALQDVVEVKQKQYGTLPQSSSVTRIIKTSTMTVFSISSYISLCRGAYTAAL